MKMHKANRTGLNVILLMIVLIACANKVDCQDTYTYKPDNQQLYDTIVKLDSAFFEAYNTCSINLEKYASFYDDDIEFYHDQSGISTSKHDIVEATKNNICGKVTRELVKGSIEVYPVGDYGAVEFGWHKFHNNQNPPDATSHAGRFVVIWQHKENGWKIKRVISLH